MTRVFAAFFRALVSQLHPRMLALLIGPLIIAVVFWIVVALFFWDPLIEFLRTAFFEGGGVLQAVFDWIAAFGLGELRGVVVVITALMLLLPLMLVTAVLLVAVLSMPAVNLHLGRGTYRDVDRRGGWSVFGSLWNAVFASLLFLVGYVVTIPLWLVPPLAFVVPWLWWGWFTARVMRFDSLVEHADDDELRALSREHRTQYLMLGLLVSVLNYVPLMFLVTPVLSALAFGHFSLSLLRDRRAAFGGRAVRPMPAPLSPHREGTVDPEPAPRLPSGGPPGSDPS
jgi:hypothetical protein